MSHDGEEFDDAVRRLAEKDGVTVLLAIPGVWELVAEEYNNAAIDLVAEENPHYHCVACDVHWAGTDTDCPNCGADGET